MALEIIPTLNVLRTLYSQPRAPARFQAYLQEMLGGTNDVVMPIMSVNPMGKEHCLEAVEALVRIDAEAAVRGALAECERRLGPLDARISLNLIDDVAGGWTNRYLTEAELRFGSRRGERARVARRFVLVPCWTAETHTPEAVRQETLAAVFRIAWRDRHGLPDTLREQVLAEGAAIAFGGGGGTLAPSLTADALANARRVLDSHEAAGDFPTQFACWFGDDAAAAAGYPALGLPPRAGFAVALAGALATGKPPEQLLLAQPERPT